MIEHTLSILYALRVLVAYQLSRFSHFSSYDWRDGL